MAKIVLKLCFHISYKRKETLQKLLYVVVFIGQCALEREDRIEVYNIMHGHLPHSDRLCAHCESGRWAVIGRSVLRSGQTHREICLSQHTTPSLGRSGQVKHVCVRCSSYSNNV